MVDDATDRSAGTGQPDAVNTPAAPGPVSNDTTAHFTEDFRFIIEAKVIRQTEWMAGEVPADDFRAMVIVRGVLRDTQPSTDT